MTWFSILTPGRSGSTYLTKYLSSCPNTHMYGEIFHSNQMKRLIQTKKKLNNHDIKRIMSTYQNNPVKYVNFVYGLKGKKINVGSKIVFSEIGWDKTNDYIKNVQGMKLVLLWRKNLTHRYVSAKHADAYKMWHVYDKKKQNKKRPPIEIDIEWLENKLTFEKEKFQTILNTLSNYDHFSLEYEDMFDSSKNEINNMIDFLGIKPPKSKPKNLPIKSIKDYSFVKNKKEINDRFGEEFGYLR